MRKFTAIVGFILLLTIAAAGCGNKQEPVKPAQPVKPETQKVSVYYTDDQLLKVFPVEKEISFSAPEQKYLASLKALQHTEDSAQIALWEKAEFVSADLKDKALTVNVKFPVDANLGAGGEELAVQALLQTMFQFAEIETVDILVDGKSAESLMGHVELQHPFSRNSLE